MGDVKPRSDYHGSDGFGDVPDPNAPDGSYLELEHASQALIRMSNEHVGMFWYCRRQGSFQPKITSLDCFY